MKLKSLSASPKLLLQILWDFLYFPLWWYSKGAWRFGRLLYGFLTWQQASLGVGVWIKNIFVPMYGQKDITSRFISFFIRLVQIIFRGLFLFLLFILTLALFLAYLVLPVAVLYAIIYQLI